MLRHLLSYSRFAVLIPVIGALIAAVGLLLYEAAILLKAAWAAAWQFASSAKDAKALAVGLVEAVDIFLIAIAMYIISLGLYVLFVDDTLPLPKWLEIRNLDDLKAQSCECRDRRARSPVPPRGTDATRGLRPSRVWGWGGSRYWVADLLPWEG